MACAPLISRNLQKIRIEFSRAAGDLGDHPVYHSFLALGRRGRPTLIVSPSQTGTHTVFVLFRLVQFSLVTLIERVRGAERGRERESQAGSTLTVAEPDARFKLTNCEIMT